MITLGIDPGSTRVGYGVVRKERGALVHLESGLLPVRSKEKNERLIEISTSLRGILARVKPDRVGIEKLYFSKNQKTAIEVAQARGVLLYTIARTGILILEFTPSEVKLAVTGDGNATKAGVAAMVARFLRLPPRKLVDDVSDALAIAITASNGTLYLHTKQGVPAE
ncbi:MAG: crossover junction endodeoxyribonuclease RuvC [Candidatus Jorgensenbacteria bacterium]